MKIKEGQLGQTHSFQVRIMLSLLHSYALFQGNVVPPKGNDDIALEECLHPGYTDVVALHRHCRDVDAWVW